jgi:hypothetical protein
MFSMMKWIFQHEIATAMNFRTLLYTYLQTENLVQISSSMSNFVRQCCCYIQLSCHQTQSSCVNMCRLVSEKIHYNWGIFSTYTCELRSFCLNPWITIWPVAEESELFVWRPTKVLERLDRLSVRESGMLPVLPHSEFVRESERLKALVALSLTIKALFSLFFSISCCCNLGQQTRWEFE